MFSVWPLKGGPENIKLPNAAYSDSVINELFVTKVVMNKKQWYNNSYDKFPKRK